MKKIREEIKKVKWDFDGSNTSYYTHSIHPYPAKFIPQIAENFLNILSKPGDRVWDPFCGSGTTGLESVLAGCDSVNTDINPLSKIIGTTKTTKITSGIDKELEDLIKSLETNTLNSYDKDEIIQFIPDIPNLEHWFSKIAVNELALIRCEISKMKNKKARNIALTAFSKIITSVSYQMEETKYSSKKTKLKSGTCVNSFIKSLKSIIKKLHELKPRIRKSKAIFETHNCVENIPNTKQLQIKDESLDIIITSPPYPNANDYFLYNRFRLFWLGYDPRKMGKIEVGSHLRHQKEKTGFEKYMMEMNNCIDNIFSSLKPGGYAVFVVGDGVYNKKVFHTGKEILKKFRTKGGKEVINFKRSVHKTKRSFSPSARRLNEEEIIVIQK